MTKNDFLELFKKIQSETDKVTQHFALYIKNEHINLDERWTVFKAAPGSLQVHDTSVCHFAWEQTHGEISWYDDFYKDKYALVNMVEIVEHMEEEDKYSIAQVDDMKAEILSKNLGSFEYDW